MTNDRELVWLPAELAKQVEALNGDKPDELILSYIRKQEDSMQADIEAFDYVVLQYKGLCAKARQDFGKAADDITQQSYAVWEEFEKSLPSLESKVATITSALKPLESDVKAIGAAINEWDLNRIERALDIVKRINEMTDDEKSILRTMING